MVFEWVTIITELKASDALGWGNTASRSGRRVFSKGNDTKQTGWPICQSIATWDTDKQIWSYSQVTSNRQVEVNCRPLTPQILQC